MKNSIIKKIVIPSLIGILILFFTISSCSKAKVPATTIDTNTCKTVISYKSDIEPIMKTHCISCHSQNNASGGVNLSTYPGVSSKSTKVLNSIMQNGSAQSMPTSYKLADSLIQKVNCWISQGTKNN